MQRSAMRAILLFPILLALTGCANNWFQTRADPTPLDQAQAKCDLEALRSTAAIRNGLEAGFMSNQIRTACMLAEGWRR